MYKPNKLNRTLLTASVALAVSAPVSSQVLEEVIVTAQKREQSVQDVPVSMTVFSKENLIDMSLRTVGDVMDFSPNVSRSSGPSSGQNAHFFFRGVGQVDNSVNVDPGVGVYIDNVYLGRLQGSSLDLLDIERVEILRGPQGTFFGRNTVGGAVSVTTSDPASELGFRGRFIAGERDRYDAAVTVDVPLSPSFRSRFSLQTRNQDGWVKSDLTGVRQGDIEELGGRIKLAWDASESLTLMLNADYAEGKGSPIPTTLVATNPLAGAIPANSFGPGAPPFNLPPGGPTAVPFPADLAADIVENPFRGRNNASIPGQLETDRGGLSLQADWGLDKLTVRSITAWRMVEQLTHTDLDGGGYSFYDSIFGVDQSQFSQELQFLGDAFEGRMQWLLGLYYFEEDVVGSSSICTGTGSAIPSGLPPGAPQFFPGPATRGDGRCLSFVSNIDLDVESWAAFGQVDWTLTDKLTGIVGFRYTEEEKTQEFDTFSDNTDRVGSFLPPPIAPAPGEIVYAVSPNAPVQMVPFSYTETWDEFTPKLGLNYDVAENVMLYTSWSRGFKSGGFSGRATPLKPLESYDPETIESWEIGMKSDWLDRRLRLNVAAFTSDYEDVQLLILDAEAGGNAQFITANGGDNRIKGVEVELTAMLTERLQFTLGGGWLDTKWTSLNPGVVEKGDKLPNAPKYTVNSSLRYNQPLGDFGDLVLRADYAYKDESTFQTANQPGDFQDGYGLLNLRATLRPHDQAWSVAVYGRNVTDKNYFLTKSDARSDLGVHTASPAPPAEWGVEILVEF